MTPVSDPGLWLLFGSAFVSSTLLPGGSELVLALLAVQGEHPPGQLLVVATAGNTLGAMTSWLIGRGLARVRPLNDRRHRQAIERLQRWGSPVLLLSWLPVVGDPLCLAAGWLGISARPAALYIALGKAGRYAVLLSLV